MIWRTGSEKHSSPPKIKHSVRYIWDNIKSNNIHIIEVSGGKERKQEIENLLEEIITGNFPNPAKQIVIQVQDAQSPKQDEPKEAHTKTHHN